MTDLYLIAHKVRGAPAFDIAEHMTCPKCNATDDHCTQCDGAGHWWIIPTSGHRAFPWNHARLEDVMENAQCDFGPMPPSLRDHYTTTAEASIDLIRVLGLIHAPLGPKPPIKRRF